MRARAARAAIDAAITHDTMALTAEVTDDADVAVETPDEEAEWEIVSFTRHARRRGARRNVAPDAVEYVLAHGRMLQRTGAMFFFLGRRDIPPCDRCASWAARLEGVIVVVGSNGDIITVYRNRHGLHHIERKMKYRLFAHKRHATHYDEPHFHLAARATA